jgi:GxxExxY protein
MIHGNLTGAIIRVFYDVYNDLGYGFLEKVYSLAMAVALKDAGLSFNREVAIPVWFRDTQVGDYRADFLIENLVIVEIKAMRALDVVHASQVTNYLKATDLEVGLLFNFGPTPMFKRIVFSSERKGHRGSGGSGG